MHDISVIDWTKKIYSCFWKCGWQEKSSPGWPQIYFLFNRFSGDILFSFLVSFALFDSCFCLFICLLFFEIKYVYMWASKWKKNFHSASFWKQDYFFLTMVYPIFISVLESQYVNILHWAHNVKFNSMTTITITWNKQRKFVRSSSKQ